MFGDFLGGRNPLKVRIYDFALYFDANQVGMGPKTTTRISYSYSGSDFQYNFEISNHATHLDPPLCLVNSEARNVKACIISLAISTLRG